MTEDKPIYISAEDDVTTVRERLSTTASRYVTLIIPEQSQLRSLTAWRILHKSARELGKEVSVISTDPLVRSVAKEANFSVAPSPTSTLSSKAGGRTGKSRPPSRPGGTVKLSGSENASEPGNPKGTGATKEKTSSLFRSTKLPSSPSSSSLPSSSPTRPSASNPTSRQQTPETEQIRPWYGDVPQPASPTQRETERPVEPISPTTTDALFSHNVSLSDTEPQYGQIYDLDMSDGSPSFGKHSSPSIEAGTPYSVDDEDYKFAENIRNSVKGNAVTPQTPFSPSTPAHTESASTTPLESAETSFTSRSSDIADISDTPGMPDGSNTSKRYKVQDLRRLQNEPYDGDIHDIGDASYRTTPLPFEGKDPYANMDDDIRLPSSLAEQHASATVDSLDTSEHSIQSASSDGIDGEVEYLGDSDEGIHSSAMATPIISGETMHAWGEPLPDEEQPDDVGPSRLNRPSNRSRRETRGSQTNQAGQARSGQLGQKGREGRTYGAVSARPELDEPDFLPPHERAIEDRPTVTMSPQEVQAARNRRPSGKIPTSPITPSKKLQGATGAIQNRTQKPPSKALPAEPETARRVLQPVPMRTTPTPTRQGQQRTQGQPIARGSTRRPSSAKATKKLPPPRRSNGIAYVIPIVIVAIIIGLLAYLGPTASVAIALPAKDYSHAVTLKAGTGTGVVPSVQFSNDFVASSVGKATGTANVGTAPASGTVTIANTGSIDVTIPSNTVVTTGNGISFATTAEAVVTKAGDTTSNPVEVPILAQSPGQSGNVAASTITVIPNTSLNAIAHANNGTAVANIKLTIVNTNPTTGGGTGTAPAARQTDINAIKVTLDKMLDAQYQAWLKQHTTSADLAGILSSGETWLSIPNVNTPLSSDGTFTAKRSRNVTIVVIRATTLQQASATQMNQALKGDKNYSGYTVVSDLQHPIQVEKLQTKLDGKVVTFSFIGAGKIVPDISTQQIQHLIAGKRASDARTLLLDQLPSVRDVTITTGPKIGNWTPGIIPLWTGHIDVQLVPGP